MPALPRDLNDARKSEWLEWFECDGDGSVLVMVCSELTNSPERDDGGGSAGGTDTARHQGRRIQPGTGFRELDKTEGSEIASDWNWNGATAVLARYWN